MMRMVVVDCWKYLEFCLSQICSTKLMGTNGLTKNEVNVDFCSGRWMHQSNSWFVY